MLSEDFALAGTTKMPWEQWYNEEIVNNEMYKTLFFKYKDTMYQFEPINSEDKGKILNGKLMTEESYMFLKLAEFFLQTFFAMQNTSTTHSKTPLITPKWMTQDLNIWNFYKLNNLLSQQI